MNTAANTADREALTNVAPVSGSANLIACDWWVMGRADRRSSATLDSAAVEAFGIWWTRFSMQQGDLSTRQTYSGF